MHVQRKREVDPRNPSLNAFATRGDTADDLTFASANSRADLSVEKRESTRRRFSESVEKKESLECP